MPKANKNPKATETRLGVITGSASGLGRELCLALAGEGGWHLILCDLDEDRNQRVLGEVLQSGGSGQAEKLDVASIDSWHELERRLRTRFSKIDLLVNNAGITAFGEIGTIPIATWKSVLDINLWGTIFGCHVFVPWLKENPGASIVNVASAMSFVNWPRGGAYNASKAAVVSLSETLYAELKRHRIHVAVICPGVFRTNLVNGGVFSAQVERDYVLEKMERSPLSARGVAKEVLRAILDKRFYVMIPFSLTRLPWAFKRLMPRLFLRVIEFIGGMEMRGLDRRRP